MANGGEMSVLDIKVNGSDVTVDFHLAVSMGIVPGFDFVHKFGLNETVGATFETCWSGSSVYSYLAAETLLNISSGDADDTAAGAGAQQIHIAGQDGLGHRIGEEVLLNGQTAVPTKKKYLHIHSMKVIRGDSNQGIIYAGTGGPASGVPTNSYGEIPVGYGQTLQAIHKVPAGFTGYLFQHTVSSGIAKNVVSRLMVRELGGVFQVKDVLNLIEDSASSDWVFPLMIRESSDIEIQVLAGGAGGSVSATFSVLQVKDN